MATKYLILQENKEGSWIGKLVNGSVNDKDDYCCSSAMHDRLKLWERIAQDGWIWTGNDAGLAGNASIFTRKGHPSVFDSGSIQQVPPPPPRKGRG